MILDPWSYVSLHAAIDVASHCENGSSSSSVYLATVNDSVIALTTDSVGGDCRITDANFAGLLNTSNGAMLFLKEPIVVPMTSRRNSTRAASHSLPLVRFTLSVVDIADTSW